MGSSRRQEWYAPGFYCTRLYFWRGYCKSYQVNFLKCTTLIFLNLWRYSLKQKFVTKTEFEGQRQWNGPGGMKSISCTSLYSSFSVCLQSVIDVNAAHGWWWTKLLGVCRRCLKMRSQRFPLSFWIKNVLKLRAAKRSRNWTTVRPIAVPTLW